MIRFGGISGKFGRDQTESVSSEIDVNGGIFKLCTVKKGLQFHWHSTSLANCSPVPQLKNLLER